jgi:hypothetical protein
VNHVQESRLKVAAPSVEEEETDLDHDFNNVEDSTMIEEASYLALNFGRVWNHPTTRNKQEDAS